MNKTHKSKSSSISSQIDRNNVKVVVRVRPFSDKERGKHDVQKALDVIDDQVIVQMTHGTGTPELLLGSPQSKHKQTRSFRYDHCYMSNNHSNIESQEQIFYEIGLPLLDHAFKGFNNCIFAYGQTGSGKSYTMMGTSSSEGIIPRISREIFTRIQTEKIVNESKNIHTSYTVEVSYLEIYNEKVRDLLNPKNKSLKVREHLSLGPYVEDLSKMAVNSFDEIRSLIAEGNKTRTVASTDMNRSSSRSHAVFTITLTQVTVTANQQTDLATEKSSRISLIDLAGSERSSSSGTTGIRLKEGSEINKSLTTLGRVISALSDQSIHPSKSQVIPYRDSTLTWLLKDSLGGNSMTTMIATVSPSHLNIDQTLSTLRFADSAKRIQNRAVVNEDPNAKLIRQLKEELDRLKLKLGNSEEDQLESLREQLQVSEKLLSDVNLTWAQRLERTNEIQRQREKILEDLGINLDNRLIGLHTPKKVPHLVNLSEDPLLTECLVYNIKNGITLVSNADYSNSSSGSSDEIEIGIRLHGDRILKDHCYFKNVDDKVTICPSDPDALVIVNGTSISDEYRIHSAYRIILGGSHVFRFNHPLEALKHRKTSSNAKVELGSPLKKFANTEDSVSLSSSSNENSDDLYSTDSADWEYAIHEAADKLLAQNKTGLINLDDENFHRLFEEMEKIKVARVARSESSIGYRPETPIMFPSPPVMSPPSNNYSPRHLRNRSSIVSLRGRSLSRSLFDHQEDKGVLIFGGQDIVLREKRMKDCIDRWKKVKVVKLVHLVFELSRLIRKAQVIAVDIEFNGIFQLMVIDKYGYNPSEHDLILEEIEEQCSTISISDKEQLCVRVMDFDNSCIRIWPVEKFRCKLNKYQNLIKFQNCEHFKKLFGFVSEQEHKQDFTYLGYADADIRLLEIGNNSTVQCELISPYTYSISGMLVLTLGDGNIDISSASLQKLGEDEIGDVYVSLSIFDTTTMIPKLMTSKTFPVKTYSNNMTLCSNISIMSLTRNSIVRFSIYGKVTKKYLDKLVSWDEMQECKCIISGPVYPGSGIDMAINVQSLELNEDGKYVSSGIVKSDGSYIILHQGLQRRMKFTVSCPTDLFSEFEPTVRFGKVRLVDPQGIENNVDTNNVTTLPLVGRIYRRVEDTCMAKLSFECQWDSSAHRCEFLDRTTKNHYKVVFESRISLKLANDSVAEFKFDLVVVVKARNASVSRWDLLLGNVKIVDNVSYYFEFQQVSAVPQTLEDFYLLQQGEGQGKCRGVSLLREYFRNKERGETVSSLQYNRAKYGNGVVVNDKKNVMSVGDYDKLHTFVNVWKKRHASIDDRLKAWDYRELVDRDVFGDKEVKQQQLIFRKVTMLPDSIEFYCDIQVSFSGAEIDVNYVLEGFNWIKMRLELRAGNVYMYQSTNYDPEMIWINLFNWEMSSNVRVVPTKPLLMSLKHVNPRISSAIMMIFISFGNKNDFEGFMLQCNRQLNSTSDQRYL